MSSERDLENNFHQEGIELSDVLPNSTGEARRPQTPLNDANNSTQQSSSMTYGGDQSPTANERAWPPRPHLPAGHPRLAELMSGRPQMWIYRRFGYLNSQNLLYMQAELMGLEKELKDLQMQDATNTSRQDSIETGEQVPHDNHRRRAGDWKELSKTTSHATEEAGGQRNEELLPRGASCCMHRRCEEWCCGERELHGHCPQWNLALKIREKLQRYSKFTTGPFYLLSSHIKRMEANHALALYRSLIFSCQSDEALIQQMRLASAGAPDSYDLDWIQSCFASTDFDMKDALKGDDKLLWGIKDKPEAGEHVYDLVTLGPPSKRDPFHEWISKKLVKRILNRKSCWNRVFKSRSLKDKTLVRWTTAATSAVTATVPIVSVVVLYFTPNTNVRLGLLAVFNLLAAFVLYIFTDAQPMQVFAASAAYSAVNIVFISSNATADR